MDYSKIYIRYLYHSGFTVETSDRFLVFDYWERKKGSRKKVSLADGILSSDFFPAHKKIYVFASHGHRDHFDPVILNWENNCLNIRYVFSSDIPVKEKENVFIMNPYEKESVDGVEIKTFGSTDLGVSFLVYVDGYNLFHAGDLNMWYWRDESTEEELAEAEANYITEANKLLGEQIDVAFFPVDPRLGDCSGLGGDYFIRHVKPSIFIPMHFGEDYATTHAFADKYVNSLTNAVPVREKGQLYTVIKKGNTVSLV